MHQAALDYIIRTAEDEGFLNAEFHGIDVGGRETNGNARWPFVRAHWTVIDAAPGPGVDVVVDAALYEPPEPVEFVLFAEVAEHTPVWRHILVNICRYMLKPGGLCIMTMAGPGREVHGLNHDDPLVPGWYENIAPAVLNQALRDARFSAWEIDVLGEDVRAWARS